MKKVFAGLVVVLVAALVSLGVGVPAQAYPDTPPTGQGAPPQVRSAAPTSHSSDVANVSAATDPAGNGGPHTALLGGGVVLLLLGGAVFLVSRRRQTV